MTTKSRSKSWTSKACCENSNCVFCKNIANSTKFTEFYFSTCFIFPIKLAKVHKHFTAINFTKFVQLVKINQIPVIVKTLKIQLTQVFWSFPQLKCVDFFSFFFSSRYSMPMRLEKLKKKKFKLPTQEYLISKIVYTYCNVFISKCKNIYSWILKHTKFLFF